MSSGLYTRFPSTFLTTSSTKLSRNAWSLLHVSAWTGPGGGRHGPGSGTRYLLSDQGHGVVLSIPMRVAADFDALGLNTAGQVGEVARDFALSIRRLDDDSVAALAFRIDKTGDDVRLDAVEQCRDCVQVPNG